MGQVIVLCGPCRSENCELAVNVRKKKSLATKGQYLHLALNASVKGLCSTYVFFPVSVLQSTALTSLPHSFFFLPSPEDI